MVMSQFFSMIFNWIMETTIFFSTPFTLLLWNFILEESWLLNENLCLTCHNSGNYRKWNKFIFLLLYFTVFQFLVKISSLLSGWKWFLCRKNRWINRMPLQKWNLKLKRWRWTGLKYFYFNYLMKIAFLNLRNKIFHQG